MPRRGSFARHVPNPFGGAGDIYKASKFLGQSNVEQTQDYIDGSRCARKLGLGGRLKMRLGRRRLGFL